MNCDEFENRIQQLLDRRLPLADDKPIARHAVACRRCHRTLQAYQDLSLGLDAWDPPTLDAGFAQRVVAIVGAVPALPAARRNPLVPGRGLPWPLLCCWRCGRPCAGS